MPETTATAEPQATTPEATATPTKPADTSIIATLTLPVSGKTATVKRGYGRDLLAANREAPDQESVQFALIAQLCKLDGEDIFLDDVLTMDLRDLGLLMQAVEGKAPTQK